jgi:hypothetical protein
MDKVAMNSEVIKRNTVYKKGYPLSGNEMSGHTCWLFVMFTPNCHLCPMQPSPINEITET